MFDWVQGISLEKKLFKVLIFLNPLIKFVTLLQKILKYPECEISWKFEHISILGPNLPKFLFSGQDPQFEISYLWLTNLTCSDCQIS